MPQQIEMAAQRLRTDEAGERLPAWINEFTNASAWDGMASHTTSGSEVAAAEGSPRGAAFNADSRCAEQSELAC